MRWKAKNKKTTDETPKVVTGSGRKRLSLGKKQLLWIIPIAVVLLIAGLAFSASSDDASNSEQEYQEQLQKNIERYQDGPPDKPTPGYTQ